jgi:hypothetical protein
MIALLCQIGLSDTDSVVSEDLDSESGSSKIIITPKKGEKTSKSCIFLLEPGGLLLYISCPLCMSEKKRKTQFQN